MEFLLYENMNVSDWLNYIKSISEQKEEDLFFEMTLALMFGRYGSEYYHRASVSEKDIALIFKNENLEKVLSKKFLLRNKEVLFSNATFTKKYLEQNIKMIRNVVDEKLKGGLK